ncbi:MAG TPA: ABC transporter ATP-binding protein [Candidatus Avoscillospira stercorigallinarum]|uniref:ABC transporter ATP-binding protein n=1 Tax=Candidatus Avoscillospira stercorigallinarum TaxID=2840708 RepID=A0A9D0Z8D9_9FIRM|nr:ABC transporter ATP-binding protein [Candidatus Avoscillospira stercorigallinarum]
MSKLVCENLTKKYGDKTVLDHVNLTLESGKIYGLIGRNGAGKTTLLSLMSNQNPITEGTAVIDGQRIWENPKVLSRLCFSRELNLSAESALSAYTLKAYLRAAETYLPHWDKEMAQKLLDLFGLDKKKKLGKLSKGMLSMVTILVAMASKAEFTFLDEPVAGLDVVAREQFYQLLLEEYTETGRTFVLSTHIIEEAADVMEEVIILDKGKILMKENTQELVDRARYVTGLADQVDGATAGLPCHHIEKIGRSKTVTVLLPEGKDLNPGYDVTVQPVNLQKLFVALCGEEVHL